MIFKAEEFLGTTTQEHWLHLFCCRWLLPSILQGMGKGKKLGICPSNPQQASGLLFLLSWNLLLLWAFAWCGEKEQPPEVLRPMCRVRSEVLHLAVRQGDKYCCHPHLTAQLPVLKAHVLGSPGS